jgi:hypothetical protein
MIQEDEDELDTLDPIHPQTAKAKNNFVQLSDGMSN